MSVILSVISDKTVFSKQALAKGSGGKAVHVKAIKGGQYLLEAGRKELSPENITVKRVGKNLHVALEGSDPERPELIIEDFFGNEGQLVGLAEDGIYYEYIATDGDEDSAAAFLVDGVSSPLALGKQPLIGFADGLTAAQKDGFGVLPWVLGGLGLAGAAAAGGGGGGGGGKDNGGGAVVDTTPPVNKGIDTIIDDKGAIQGELVNGGVTDDSRPTLSGKGQDPGDKVTVIDNGKVIGETVVDGNGNWSFTPEAELGDGEHSFEVVVKDPAGSSSGPSDDFVVIIDTTPPINPGIESIIDDQGTVTGKIDNGGRTDDSRPSLSGKGEPGDSVDIIDNGSVIGQVQVGDDGRWSFTPEDALSDGEHAFEIVVTDPAGNSSEPSDPYVVEIESGLPFKPSIDAVIDGEGELRGPLASGDTTDDAKPLINGSGQPGSVVAIFDNGVELGRAAVDPQGKWSFSPTLPMQQGGHTLTAETVDDIGRSRNPSDPFVVVVGNQEAPAVPAITSVVDDVGSITGNIQKNGITDDARPTVNGTAQAGMKLSVYVDGKLVGSTVVDTNGEWTFTLPNDLADGLHNIAAAATNVLGVISPRTGEYPIMVDTTAPAKPGSDAASLLDDQAPMIGTISNGTVTDDNTPTFVGKAEPNATVVIYDGDVRIGETNTDAEGNWSFTPSPVLEDGEHALSYLVVDAAGNIGPKSDVITFEVDTSLVVVSIEGAIDAVGGITGAIVQGGVTDDARPELHGKATAGGIVKIYEGGVLLGQAAADAQGNWRLQLDASLVEGEHRLQATVTTGAAGESSPSTVFDFSVDTTAPAEPTIERVLDDVGAPQGALSPGQSTDDTTPTLSGKAEAGTIAHIHDNGDLIGSVPVDANGNWSFTPSPPLANGPHDFFVTAEDKAGNISKPSAGFGLIVDTVAPAQPVIDSVYDDQGNQTGYLTSGDATDDAKPLLAGRAEEGATVVIRDHGNEIGRTVAGPGGQWSFEPSLPLLEGEHVFTVVAVDAAGNSSPVSESFALTVGNPDMPAAPAITAVIDDVGSITGAIQKLGVTDDARPTIQGTAQAGMTVTIYIDGVLAGTTQASGTGEWSFTPGADLSEGLRVITAEASNSLGNTSPRTGEYPIVVDTQAPPPADATLWDDTGKVTGQISNGSITDDSTPTFVGTAEPNAIVVIYDDGVEIGRAQSDADGAWTFTPTKPLLDGDHSLSHAVIDVAGNLGRPSEQIDFKVDTSTLVISIDSASDDAGSIRGAIAKGGVTDDVTPTLHGMATAGGTVTIYEGGVVLGQTVAGSDGSWTFTPATGLSEGVHELTATVTTVAIGESDHSGVFDFSIDVTAPAVPTIVQVTDDVGALQGVLGNGQSTDDTTPTLSGTADAGSTVHIHGNGGLLGSVVADAAGNWSFTPSPPLLNGRHDFTVTAEDKAGNVSAHSDVFAIIVDTVAPAAPLITAVYDDQGDLQGMLKSGDATDDAQPTISGSAEPNSTVIIMDAGIEIGRARADANGAWVFEPGTDLMLGGHVLSAVAQDAAGNTSAPSEEFALVVGNPALPDMPAITTVVDDVGPISGLIQSNGVTDDAQPALVGTAQAGMLVTVYIDGVLAGMTVADANGDWSFTPADALIDGVHAFTATATNALGNISAATPPYLINVDTTPPDKPGENDAELLDNAGQITGKIVNGTVTDDNTPSFVGKAEPNAMVVIYDKGSEIGRAQADDQGGWTFTPGTPLADGDHTFSYEVVDQAGGASQRSDEINFSVDTAPVTVSIDGGLDDVGPITGDLAFGSVTDDSTPTLFGKANAGGLVKLYDGSVLIGEVLVDVDGNWSFTPQIALSEGLHTLHATVTTPAHGESSSSNAFELTVDITAPGKPLIESIMDDVGATQGKLLNGQHTDDATPTLIGKADAGSQVNIYDNGVLRGTVTADASGVWSFTPAAPLAEGAHVFTVSSVDPAGNSSGLSGPYAIVVDTVVPGRPTIDTVFDDQGDMQGSLTTGATTDDAKPILNGKAEANTVVIIKDQGVEIGRALADASGRWSFEPALPLLQGAHAFSVVAVDAAGNSSEPSNQFLLGVLTDARPSAPAILGVMDDVGALTGIIQKNGVTDDVRPTVYGTALAGSIVSIYIDDVLLGTTQSDSKGSWSYTPNVDFPEGLRMLHATATAGGVVSAKTGNYPILVDTTAPAAPGASDAALWDLVGDEVTPIVNGTVTDDRTPAFNGKAEAKATIIIYDHGQEIGRAATNAAGNWMFSPMPVLADGPHSFSYAVMDAAGNTSPKSKEIQFVVDTSGVAVSIEGADDDVGSKQGAITDGGVTDDTRPSIHGKAIPGAIVTVYDGGLVLGQTIVAVDGTWRFEVDTAMRSGLHSLSAKVFSEAGIELGASAVFYLVVDITPAGKAHIEQIIDDVGGQQGWLNNGQSTDDGTPTLAGTAEPGMMVRIYDNNSLLGTVVADAEGVWSFTPTTLLNNGKHVFTVTAVDEAGNASVASDSYTVVVDTLVAVAPTIDSAYDDKGDMQGTLSSGATTDDAKPVLSGRAEAGTIIIISDNGVEIGRTLAGANGRWSFEPVLPLAQGAHGFTAESLDAAGNMSANSKSFSLQVFIENPPDAAAITAVMDDEGSLMGAIQKGGATNDARPTITGTAPLGMTVSVYIDDVLVGSTMADGRGYWSYTLANPLANGSHQISASATTTSGGMSARTGSYTIVVDTVAPLKPGAADASLWSGAGTLGVQIEPGSITGDSTPTFSGRAEANATVLVYDKGREIGLALTDASGNWVFTPVPALADGSHRLAYKVMDAAGNASPLSTEIAFTVDSAQVAVSIDGALDDVGGKQGVLVAGSVIDDTTPTLFGKGVVGGIVKVYEGTTLLGQAVVAIDGSWRLTPTQALGEGIHHLHATVTSPGQPESGASASFTVTVDISAPDRPTIASAVNDVGEIQGVLDDGQTVDDTTPTLIGKAEAGSTVFIYDNGSLLGVVQAGSNSDWSFTPTTPLINGEHVFTVNSSDVAGNVSAPSTPYAVVVDTIAPDKPTIDAAYDDQGDMQGTLASGDDTDDQLPVLNGKAEAGSMVVILDNGAEIGRVVADGSGRWSYALTVPLSMGAHVFTLTAVDAAGNVSVASNGFQLTVALDASVDPLLASALPAAASEGVLPASDKAVLAASGSNDDKALPEVTDTLDAVNPVLAAMLVTDEPGYAGIAAALLQPNLPAEADSSTNGPSLQSLLSNDAGEIFPMEVTAQGAGLPAAGADQIELNAFESLGDEPSFWMHAAGSAAASAFVASEFAAGNEAESQTGEWARLYAI